MFLHWSLSSYKNCKILPNNSFCPLYYCLLTNIHWQLLNILPYYFSKWHSRSNYIKNLVKIRWPIPSYFLLIPLFLCISIELTIINTFSDCFIDRRTVWINPVTFSAAFTCSFWLWGFCFFDSVFYPYFRFIVCLLVVLAVIWIIQVTIPLKPIFGVRKASRCTILTTFDRMAVDSFDSADIQYLSLSSRDILCSQTLSHRWSFWQFKCSRTFMLKFWLRHFDNLSCIWNVSYGCHFLVLSARFLLCST